MANGKAIRQTKQRKPSLERTSLYNKALAREANKYLGTRFNTRKTALSAHALKRVREFERSGLLSGRELLKFDKPEPSAVAIKAPRALGKIAKQKGFAVVETRHGTRIVAPNSPEAIKRYRQHIREGRVPGVTMIGEAGFEHVVLPFDVNNMHKLLATLESGALDGLKNEEELFAFKFFGRNSLATFGDTESLINYMRKQVNHYVTVFPGQDRQVSPKNMAEEFEHFELIRYDPDRYEWLQSPPRKRRAGGRGTAHAQDRRERIERTRGRAAVTAQTRQIATAAERVSKSRSKETPEHRAERLRKQKAYQRRYRIKDK